VEGARRAAPEDAARIARLIEAARSDAMGMRGGLQLMADSDGPEPSASTVVSWMTDPMRLVLAGTFAGAVVGVCAGRIDEGRGKRVGIVDWCYVEPAARGVGVGTALGEAIVSWFTEENCASVDVRALPGDRSTKQLFESLGFSARLLVLHRRLP
jgi:GNAT superfamily N-acetyltransferase